MNRDQLQILLYVLVVVIVFVGAMWVRSLGSDHEHKRGQAAAQARGWRYIPKRGLSYAYTIEGQGINGISWTIEHLSPGATNRRGGTTSWYAATPGLHKEFLILPRFISGQPRIALTSPTFQPAPDEHHLLLMVMIGADLPKELLALDIWEHAPQVPAGSAQWQMAFALKALDAQLASLVTSDVEHAMEPWTIRRSSGTTVVIGSRNEIRVLCITDAAQTPDLDALVATGLELVRARARGSF